MSRWTGTSRINSDLIKRYIELQCLSDYSRYQKEFVRQIRALGKRRHIEFCNRCDKIKKKINEKDEELNRCYVNNIINVKLYQNANIKGFIEECPEIPKCYIKHNPSLKKASVLKSGTKETCGRSDCKNERAQTMNGKSQLGVDARTPKSESSQREGIVKQSSSHSHGEVTEQKKESPQGQGGIKPPDNLDMTQVKESKQIDNDHSSTNVEEKQLSQPVSASDTLSSSELGTQGSQLPARSTSSGESNSDNNNPHRQVVASKIDKDQIAGDRGGVTEISGRTSAGAVPTVPHTAPSTADDKVAVHVDKDGESPAGKDIVAEEPVSTVTVDGDSVNLPSSDVPSHDRSIGRICTAAEPNCDEARGEVSQSDKHRGVMSDNGRSTFPAENFSELHYKFPLTIKCLMLLVDTLTVLIMHNTIFNCKMTYEL
ncbi:variable surface protein Vir18-related [Plasmodium vivax]|uniref:Variable surface protein Vir18-related n=1 Tax=Plasmodium vivax (strain Salvador I) TaxID=126793 RepID=A5KD43_PLAVS|nr:variable surface protein Vir18-related [Plasmodium vivax]EDL42727.1 variable surface protein Vir18-related [Plasmodium vivax]|eukprot:XP_001612520.1 variable surface protein Vir18-related [Plasmodium vivax Sal-1]